MEQEFQAEYSRLAEARREATPSGQFALHERYALGNRERAQKFLAYLQSFLNCDMRGKRVLDIGSAYAGFSIACAAAGAEAYGVEIDPVLHRLGFINARGEPGKITLLEGDILDLRMSARLGSRPFDLVILNDVFEHVYDSAALFERLGALTGPSSVIYFSTPNGSSYQSIESEAHFSRPGLSLLPPSDWQPLVGPFNVYYRRLRHYQALFQSCGFPYQYLTPDMKLLEEAVQIIPTRFAALEEKLSASAFGTHQGLRARAIANLHALKREIEDTIARKDCLALHLNFGQHSWTGFATRQPHLVLASHRAIISFGPPDAHGQAAPRTLEPAVLVGEDFVDLSAAVIESQEGVSSVPRAALDDESRRACVALTNKNNPRRGDFTRWRLVVPADPSRKYLVSVFVKNDYENPRFRGRVAWHVAINGTPIYSEDIALSAQRRRLKAFLSEAKRIEIELELRALCDCEPWHWGAASTTFIDGIMIQECPPPLSVA